MYNKRFDPLRAKYEGNDEVVIMAMKREINNILGSYVGWFDPFSEMIQNALDAVDARDKIVQNYSPLINIAINIQENSISVTDNGIGFDEDRYTKFLAPNFSFKKVGERGHKGVGATYLAYGFNYFQIATKAERFSAQGIMLNARDWLHSESGSGNPKVEPDDSPVVDTAFNDIDTGVSVCIKCDKQTYPKDLSLLGVDDAKSWLMILRVHTGLGSIRENANIQVNVKVIAKNGVETNYIHKGIGYPDVFDFDIKSMKLSDVQKKMDELYNKKGQDFRIPSQYTNLEAVFDKWNAEKLLDKIDFSNNHKEFIELYKPTIYFSYVNSLNVWHSINDSLGLRKNTNLFYGGIQMAANNMPQGDSIQIPLNRSIGRQNQARILVHLENVSADLGRKGFRKDYIDFAKELSQKIVDGPLSKIKRNLKRNTGLAPDLLREKQISEWKEEMENHESDNPLFLRSEHFFQPTNKISITSTPTREQDVIALFNQLIAGGVIRGVRIMSTNEREIYDGLYRVVVEEPQNNHTYDRDNNPLGIKKETVEKLLESSPHGFISKPRVLEYKYSLDGLVEDVESGTKNTNDIGMIVVWDAGTLYKMNYCIESLLLSDSVGLRQYHGITHVLKDEATGEYISDLIILKDLIHYLNDYDECCRLQEKYDD